MQLLEKEFETNEVSQAWRRYSKIQALENSAKYYSEKEFSNLGYRHLGKGMIEKAMKVFRLSTKTFPNSALGYYNLGGAHLRKGEVDSAIACHEKSLKIFPENGNALEILKATDSAQ